METTRLYLAAWRMEEEEEEEEDRLSERCRAKLSHFTIRRSRMCSAERPHSHRDIRAPLCLLSPLLRLLVNCGEIRHSELSSV